MNAKFKVGSFERLHSLELYFEDTAEYLGITGVPDVFIETLERVRSRQGVRDRRVSDRGSERRAMPNRTAALTVFT